MNRAGFNPVCMAWLGVLLFGGLVSVATADLPVRLTKTYHLKQGMSGSYLIQGYTGRRDDKRNTEAQPMESQNDENYRWLFVPSDPGSKDHYNYVVNMKTGLALTLDGTAGLTDRMNDLKKSAVGLKFLGEIDLSDNRNVSNWGMEQNNDGQLWRKEFAGSDTIAGTSRWKLTNKANGLVLTQHDLGRDPGKPNVHVWEDGPPSDRGFQWITQDGIDMDLCRLKIESIKCIKASTGKDAGTKFLFSAIETAIEVGAGLATGGASVGATAGAKAAQQGVMEGLKIGIKEGAKRAGKKIVQYGAEQLTKKALVDRAKKTVVMTTIKQSALAAGNEMADDDADSLVELAFDKIYGESPDQLEIQVNGISVWPYGGRHWRNISSQQTLPVNVEYIFPRSRSAAIQLKEYDSGSADDSLGWLELDTSGVFKYERYEGITIKNEDEGCLYEITLSVEPMEWQPAIDAMPSSVTTAEMTPGIKIGVAAAPVLAMIPYTEYAILVVNADGSVSKHQWRTKSGIRGEMKLPGARVKMDAATKAVFTVNNSIIVVDGLGNVTSQSMDGSNDKVSEPKPMPGHKIAAGIDAKAIFPMGQRIIVIDSSGDAYFHEISPDHGIGPKTRMPGVAIGVGEKPAQGIFPYGNRILEVDADGTLWAYDAFNAVSPPEAVPGVRIMTYPGFTRSFFTTPNKGIIMIDIEGNVWRHPLG